MFKGVVIALVSFVLGFLLSSTPGLSEERFALSETSIDSVQRVPFDSIEVFADEVKINYPGLTYAKVSSNSMGPVITDKSVVFEKVPSSPDEIHIGDVISFYEPSVEKIVLHLVVEIIDGSSYVTKGLANDDVDDWLVPFENVKGIMVGTFK